MSEAVTKSETSKPAVKFDHDSFFQKLTDLITDNSEESKQKLDDFAAEVWTIPTEKGLYTNNCYFDAGTASKMSSMNSGGKRIAGTQRLLAPPPPPNFKRTNVHDVDNMSKPGSSQKLGVPPLPRKKKAPIPVIDDSISSSSDQPCKVCGGVSVGGNTVLSCNVCKDSYHMKCNKPVVSHDEVSNPRYIFLCTPCMRSKSTVVKSRSSSPQVKSAETDNRVKSSLEEYKKKKMREGKM